LPGGVGYFQFYLLWADTNRIFAVDGTGKIAVAVTMPVLDNLGLWEIISVKLFR
jgi:hypothetical protein